ncbi:MAG: pyrroline-5-carboxylate reductase [Candidatus Magasanikbacteria bacterium RIFCSPHIGHO2_01_FULL_41_23]|uniref:Pyrroline-5-carboxylate reductase n=1 Tax=Candidatus Magasanikbacteria bacterium RIFCSPLOWO2_01_FULL_40_15 TaxID=1798686 RepID=A0A1F6N480_9BACT|nr:MAG: pyrroline-5-carboxylate reductase [Candidatus Magasanikbacteria bacterium RIFCSPHIGHO2_01_FULL_41_23]OGH67146.1 MAG: pyrroline-5-carboxylate reductase [Candidatus Magasanikbacteria bacterium RIFCSPHIGHO2_02_FULL_41_35]OGH76734.1 MAG: pyrroline-5-carboxylate reductase [Candidatus Magasanikbacteria bacterium RIFCSPHIGHO2_12_FULL_41_16]OGH78682.1 MAG: pyrroline-5-carboxylate reductase [Candidatus Magasanikbacteria bacterium RIFCSPLOWO2_01_FULL_40_15]
MFKKIGIVGAGVMGEVFIKQFIENLQVDPKDITACSPIIPRLEELKNRYKIGVSENNKDGLVDKDVVLLSVKPQQAKEMLESIKPFVVNQVFVSIMAGVSIQTIEKILGTKKIVRCMPNTPAQIGFGMTVWKADIISPEQKKIVQQLFSQLGEEMEVKIEKSIDASTAISGSGPAYVFDFASHLIESARALGFNKIQAKKLVVQTIIGAGFLFKGSQEDARVLRNKVTSKGGTTEAAFKIIDPSNLAKIYKKATKMAYKRAIFLKKQIK